MTFQNMHYSRIVRAVLLISFVGSLLSFGSCYCYLFSELIPKVDTNANFSDQQEQLQNDAEALMTDIYNTPPSALNIIFMIQLGVVLLLVFWLTMWAARLAQTPQEAVGHAVITFIGVMMSYGMLVFLFAPTSIVVKGLFFLALIGACGAAGQMAGQRIGLRPRPTAPYAPPYSQPTAAPTGFAPQAPSGSADTYYNMGVQAAIGGRREEARQHFTRMLQIQPRNIPAWLQLANLADTPEQAWNYIQQARSINPTDPAVMDAVNMVWPKVAASANQQPIPHMQPPYKGAGGDDAAIPRSMLPQAPDDSSNDKPQA